MTHIAASHELLNITQILLCVQEITRNCEFSLERKYNELSNHQEVISSDLFKKRFNINCIR